MLSYKRLERGRFIFPERVGQDAARVQIDGHELATLLEGLEPRPGRSAMRWEPPLARTMG